MEPNKKVDIEKVRNYLYALLDRANVTDEMYDVFSNIIDDMYNDLTDADAVVKPM